MADVIHRTVIQVEVFTNDGPYPARAGNAWDLAQLAYDIDEGDCIGDYAVISTEVIAPEDVEAHMLRIGNDGSFFDTGDED